MSTDLISVAKFIVFASEDIAIARVDKREAIVSIAHPAGHKTSRQKGVIEVRSVQEETVSEILNSKISSNLENPKPKPLDNQTYLQPILPSAILSFSTARVSKLRNESKEVEITYFPTFQWEK